MYHNNIKAFLNKKDILSWLIWAAVDLQKVDWHVISLIMIQYHQYYYSYYHYDYHMAVVISESISLLTILKISKEIKLCHCFPLQKIDSGQTIHYGIKFIYLKRYLYNLYDRVLANLYATL